MSLGAMHRRLWPRTSIQTQLLLGKLGGTGAFVHLHMRVQPAGLHSETASSGPAGRRAGWATLSSLSWLERACALMHTLHSITLHAHSPPTQPHPPPPTTCSHVERTLETFCNMNLEMQETQNISKINKQASRVAGWQGRAGRSRAFRRQLQPVLPSCKRRLSPNAAAPSLAAA